MRDLQQQGQEAGETPEGAAAGDYEENLLADEAVIEPTEQCFGILGCLVTAGEFFHPIHRPINLPANTRDEIALEYTVHSREDPKGTVVEWHVVRCWAARGGTLWSLNR